MQSILYFQNNSAALIKGILFISDNLLCDKAKFCMLSSLSASDAGEQFAIEVMKTSPSHSKYQHFILQDKVSQH